jgi:hypothetical protein
MTDDSYQSTPGLSESELTAKLGRQTTSTNSEERRRLHELRRAARTSPRVNELLKGTSAHIDYRLGSDGYGVQQSSRPTSLPHYSAPRQFGTPNSNRNLQNDFSSGSISPWSYNIVINKADPKEISRPSRYAYKPDSRVHMAGDELQRTAFDGPD